MKSEFKANLVKTYNRHARERDKHEIRTWKIQELERFAAILKDKQKRTENFRRKKFNCLMRLDLFGTHQATNTFSPFCYSSLRQAQKR